MRKGPCKSMMKFRQKLRKEILQTITDCLHIDPSCHQDFQANATLFL